jgi:hypothetical protein
MADRKDRMALLSRYSKLYKQKYNEKPTINLNVEQWASDALIESYGLQECYDLLEYYYSVANSPSWNFFAYNAENIVNAKRLREQDSKERKERRRLAKKWLNE